MSEITQWDDIFSVDNETIDNHHKQLFKLVAEADSAIKNNDEDALAEIFNQLQDYTQYHFSAEEAMMKKADYPGIADHILEHEKFISKLESVKEQFIMGGMESLSSELIPFLSEWLSVHIVIIDQEYMNYL